MKMKFSIAMELLDFWKCDRLLVHLKPKNTEIHNENFSFNSFLFNICTNTWENYYAFRMQIKNVAKYFANKFRGYLFDSKLILPFHSTFPYLCSCSPGFINIMHRIFIKKSSIPSSSRVNKENSPNRNRVYSLHPDGFVTKENEKMKSSQIPVIPFRPIVSLHWNCWGS